MAAENPIDFNRFIVGESALQAAAKSVRSLKNDVKALSKSVDDDAARIKGGFERITAAIKEIQASGGRLNVTNPEDKKLLQDYIQQVNELKKAKTDLQAQDKAGAAIQKTLNEAATAATSALKQEQAAFKAAVSSGDIEAQKKAAAAILEIKSSADQAGRAIRGANSEFTAAAGSINELRVQLSKGTAEYIALTKAERESAKGTELRDSIKKTSDELKTLEKSLGDTRRNVGNYGDAFKEVASTGLLPFSDGINRAIQVADGLKTGLASARTALYGVKEGGVVAGEGLNIVKLGIAGTGIGLLLIALTTLYEYFTKSDDGAEDLAAGLAYLKGAFGVLEGAAVSAGRAIASAVKDPKQGIEDLGEAIKTRVIDGFKGYAVLAKSITERDFKGAIDGVFQIATGTTKATDKMAAFIANTKEAAVVARELSRLGDQLEDQEIAAIALNEKQSQLAAKLVLTAKDRSLSEAKRLTNLDEAGRLETLVLQRNLSIEQNRLTIITRQNAEAQRRGELQDDDRRKQEEQQAALFRLQGEYEQQQQTIANRRSVLQQTEAADRLAAAKAAREAELEAQREVVRERQVGIERRLLAIAKGSEAELALKKEQLQAGRDLDLINDKLSANAKLLIKEKELVDEKALAEDFAKQRAELEARELERRKKLAADIQGIVEKAYKDELTSLQNRLKAEEALVGQQYANGELSRKEYHDRLKQIQQEGLADELRLDEKYAKDSADVERRKADRAIAETERSRQERQRITRQAAEGLSIVEGTYFAFKSQQYDADLQHLQENYDRDVKAAGDNTELKTALAEEFDRKERALKRKQAENDQAASLFQIAINTAVNASQYTPVNPLFYLALASGAAQAALVLSKPLPAYFKGREDGPAEFALVAERGPELIENRQTGKFRYVAQQGVEYLNAGDRVHTAERTQALLASAQADMQQLQQPLGFGRNLAASTAAIQAGRNQGAEQAGELRQIRKAMQENTAAMKNLKQVTLNVNGEVQGALVQHGDSLTRSLNQRLINYGG